MSKRKRMILAFFLSIVFMTLLAGCAATKNSPPANLASPSAEQKEALPAVSNVLGEWKSDGKISDNEYSSVQSIGDLEVYTRLAGDSVMFGLTAKTEGYLSLGIDTDGSMRDVDMIMCSVIDGVAVIGDLCGSGKHWPHPADIDSGGKMDLTDISGSRKDLTTIFEFKRKLDTGDSRDKALKIGENRVVWAVGLKNDFAAPHNKRGSGILVLKTN
jgi:hypothetical protein